MSAKAERVCHRSRDTDLACLIGYVVEGSTYLLDEDENRVEIRAGDRLNLPKGSWHAEGAATDRVTYIVTVSEPVPIFQALMPR